MSETPNVANHNVNPGGHGAGRAVPLRSRCAAATGFASRTTSLGHCVCAREGGESAFVRNQFATSAKFASKDVDNRYRSFVLEAQPVCVLQLPLKFAVRRVSCPRPRARQISRDCVVSWASCEPWRATQRAWRARGWACVVSCACTCTASAVNAVQSEDQTLQLQKQVITSLQCHVLS